MQAKDKEASKDDAPLGVVQGTMRAVLLVKIRTVMKTAAMKSFNPGKVSMFQELKVSTSRFPLEKLQNENNVVVFWQASARRRNLTIFERSREIMITEGGIILCNFTSKLNARSNRKSEK